MLHPFLSQQLVNPLHHSSLELRGEILFAKRPSADIEDQFEIVDGIPVMIELSASPTHYHTHYQVDADLFDYFAERNDPATEHDERRLRERILRRIAVDNSSSILDVGCGKAWLAQALLPQGATVCSLDISTANPRRALELYPSEKHCAVVADAYALPFRDGTFDFIVSSEVIEHVPDPRSFVHELLRCVKPGGKLIISTPYKEKLRYSLCIHCNQKTPMNAHLHSFDEDNLGSLTPDNFAGRFSFETFGNKLLHLGRSYVVTRCLPNSWWFVVDKLASSVVRKIEHIVVEWQKYN